MDDMQDETAPQVRERLSDLFDRIEAVYLKVLRITILVIATLLILYTF